MRSLVTGASGFLGRHLLEDLSRRGHEVVALVRSTSDLTGVARLGPSIVVERFSDLRAVPGIVQRAAPDVIVHTACNYGRAGEPLVEIVESNYLYGCAVLAGLASGGTTFINLDTPLTPENGPYALTKYQFREAMRAFYTGKLRLVNARLFTMYGPANNPSNFTTYVVRQFLRDAPVLETTPGEQVRDFIYIHDVVNALVAIIEASADLPAWSHFDLGSGEGVTLRRYVELVRLETGARTELRATLKYRPSDLTPMVADVADLRVLGWRPGVSLETGVHKTVEGERDLI